MNIQDPVQSILVTGLNSSTIAMTRYAAKDDPIKASPSMCAGNNQVSVVFPGHIADLCRGKTGSHLKRGVRDLLMGLIKQLFQMFFC